MARALISPDLVIRPEERDRVAPRSRADQPWGAIVTVRVVA